jgi:hypothetical protein
MFSEDEVIIKKYWSVLNGDFEEGSHKFYFSNLFPSKPPGK